MLVYEKLSMILRRRVNLLTVENLIELGFKNVKNAGDNIMCSCPLGIHKDSNPSFGINIKTGKWNCFSCGSKGNSIEYLARILHKKDLVKYFEFSSNQEIIDRINNILHPCIITEDDENDFLVTYFQSNLKDRSYLYSRGITDEVIDKFNIGLDPIKNSVVFPVYDDKSNVKGFTLRNLKGDVRYIHEVDKSSTVYGAQFLKQGPVIVVEGNMDVLKAYSLGFTNVVGLMGTAMSELQYRMIDKYATHITLGLDNDFNKPHNWGQIATKKHGSKLVRSLPVNVIKYPPGIKDFGDLKSANIETIDFLRWRLNGNYI